MLKRLFTSDVILTRIKNLHKLLDNSTDAISSDLFNEPSFDGRKYANFISEDLLFKIAFCLNSEQAHRHFQQLIRIKFSTAVLNFPEQSNARQLRTMLINYLKNLSTLTTLSAELAFETIDFYHHFFAKMEGYPDKRGVQWGVMKKIADVAEPLIFTMLNDCVNLDYQQSQLYTDKIYKQLSKYAHYNEEFALLYFSFFMRRSQSLESYFYDELLKLALRFPKLAERMLINYPENEVDSQKKAFLRLITFKNDDNLKVIINEFYGPIDHSEMGYDNAADYAEKTHKAYTSLLFLMRENERMAVRILLHPEGIDYARSFHAWATPPFFVLHNLDSFILELAFRHVGVFFYLLNNYSSIDISNTEGLLKIIDAHWGILNENLAKQLIHLIIAKPDTATIAVIDCLIKLVDQYPALEDEVLGFFNTIRIDLNTFQYLIDSNKPWTKRFLNKQIPLLATIRPKFGRHLFKNPHTYKVLNQEGTLEFFKKIDCLEFSELHLEIIVKQFDDEAQINLVRDKPFLALNLINYRKEKNCLTLEQYKNLAILSADSAELLLTQIETKQIKLFEEAIVRWVSDIGRAHAKLRYRCGKFLFDRLEIDAAFELFKDVEDNNESEVDHANYQHAMQECGNIAYCLKQQPEIAKSYYAKASQEGDTDSRFLYNCSDIDAQRINSQHEIQVFFTATHDHIKIDLIDATKKVSIEQVKEVWEKYKFKHRLNNFFTNKKTQDFHLLVSSDSLTDQGRYKLLNEFVHDRTNLNNGFCLQLLESFGLEFFNTGYGDLHLDSEIGSKRY